MCRVVLYYCVMPSVVLLPAGCCGRQVWSFDDERLSVLLGLVKEVHDASVAQRLTIERSFAFFKDTLLNHSVHRCAGIPACKHQCCSVLVLQRNDTSCSLYITLAWGLWPWIGCML